MTRAGSDSLHRYDTLRSSRDFRRVLSDGRRHRHGGITLVGAPGPARAPRLGLLVSKRCGPAVTRNRIKRRLRSAVSAVGLEPGNDYVIIGTRQVAEVPYSHLVNWLERAVAEMSDA